MTTSYSGADSGLVPMEGGRDDHKDWAIYFFFLYTQHQANDITNLKGEGILI